MGKDERLKDLAKRQADKESHQNRLESLRESIINTLGSNIQSTIDKQIRSLVTDKEAERLISLEPESRIEFKKQIDSVISSMANTTKKVFSDNSLWLHKENIEPNQSHSEYNLKKQQECRVREGVDLILSEPIELLKHYGYFQPDRYIFFRLPDMDSEYEKSELCLSITNYISELVGLSKTIYDINVLKKEMISSSAADIWDNIPL